MAEVAEAGYPIRRRISRRFAFAKVMASRFPPGKGWTRTTDPKLYRLSYTAITAADPYLA